MTLTEEVLESLTPAEQEEFKRFMAFRSPGLRSEVGDAVRLLCRAGTMDKRQLFAELFGKRKKYTDSTVRYILTDINRLLYEFLTYKRAMADGRAGRHLLLRELLARDCQSAFIRLLNQELGGIATGGDIGPEALKHRSDMLALQAEHELRQGQRSTFRFADSTEALDRHFVARKLQMSAEKLNLHFILSTRGDDPFLNTLLREVDAGRFNDTPYILLYRDIIRLLTDPTDDAAFQRLRQRATAEAIRLPHHERQDLYQHLLNHCIRRVNAGRLDFQRELFGIYREALDCGALLTDGHLSQWDFKNIVTIGLRLRETVFIEDFISGNAALLPPAQRANAVAYNTANLCFHRRDYRQALAQLQQVDLDDVFYRLDARSILLKTYFEMDDIDALFYHATAFRTFLLRNSKISDHQRKLYQNLIRFTLSLVRCGSDRSRLRALRKKVEATPNVADLAWLESQVTALI
jgi:hypothetical protein